MIRTQPCAAALSFGSGSCDVRSRGAKNCKDAFSIAFETYHRPKESSGQGRSWFQSLLPACLPCSHAALASRGSGRLLPLGMLT
jgi:hypothetical protein